MRIFLAALFCVASLFCLSQDKGQAPSDLGQYQMVMVRTAPPNWKLPTNPKVLAAGRVVSDNLQALAIVDGSSTDAEAFATGAQAEIHPWMTSKTTLQEFSSRSKGQTHFLVFLMRGDQWTPEVTPQTEDIQKRHLANIGKLHSEGKLLLAGPFMDDGVLRGIFVLKAPSLPEARAYCNTDPAVQSGRLKVDIFPWKLD